MQEQPKQCGISGRDFAEGDLYIEEVIPAQGSSAEYTRFVSVEAAGLSQEEIDEGTKAGTVKAYGPAVAE